MNKSATTHGGVIQAADLLITALLPFAVLAQPINTMNNPNQPGYKIPSQQRMQTQMQTQ
ncbi:DUF2756 domain-containing protein, partial [Salmonella enterica subsp. enterica serovar Montevideo]|nr:DUF2756 domain-containing protein [Salmonella enterica subsp. enterica serovar Montevideo]